MADERADTSGLEPSVLAMVLCDQIYIDPGTGKKSLLGIFASLRAPSFPVALPALGLYLAMTGGRGKVPIKIQLVDADEEHEPLIVGDGEVEFPDPLAVGELTIQFPPIAFPTAGEFRFQVYAYGTLLMERRIILSGPDITPEKTDG